MVIEEKLVNYLLDNKLMITTAESCTGGMIASRLINVSGVSDVLCECHVTYSEEAKMKYLGVNIDTLNKYTVVSKETALEMAVGAAKLADSDVAIAVTGIAGPGGGTKEKPVGLVYIACYYNENTIVEEHIFSGDRLSVRQETTDVALNMAFNMVTAVNERNSII